MSFASNLLQLVFSLIVGIASLLGALFIIGFLLAVPRNDFEDDNHDNTQALLIPTDQCPLVEGDGLLPVDCEVLENNSLTGLRNFTSRTCDNTVCEGCSADNNVTCCCSNLGQTSFNFTCPNSVPRPFFQPELCSCQPCDDLFIQLRFQVISSADGNTLNDAVLTITDGTSIATLNMDAAGFFNTFRQVITRTAQVNVSAPGHLTQSLSIDIIPPGPIEVVIILASVDEMLLGNNTNTSLTFDVGDQLVSIVIPPNTVVTTNNEPFEGNVIVQTVFVSMDRPTSTSDFPPEVTTSNGEVVTFYTTRVIARTQLVGQDGNEINVQLNISSNISLSVNFSQFSVGDTVSLLLFDPMLGTWVETSTFVVTTASLGKRQISQMTGTAQLPRTDVFWAIGTALNPSDICYLQVRTFEGNDVLTGVTVSVQQFRDQLGDPFFFSSIGETGDGTGPDGDFACVEVLCGSVTSGAVGAVFNGENLEPSLTQPDGIAINNDSMITFTSSTEGNPSSPFYPNVGLCGTGNTFVQFDLVLPPPPVTIPPPNVDSLNEFWFVRVEVLSCFDINRVSTISTNPGTRQASVFTTTLLETDDVVNFPTPTSCTGLITRRTTCVEAYANSTVRLQAELNEQNTINGELCFLSELTDLLDDYTTTQERYAMLDLTTLNTSNTMAGLYMSSNRFSTLDDCLNPAVDDGIFAQFECFEYPADSRIVDLPVGCINETFNSQVCSEVPCTTDTGDCAGPDAQCCYREATSTDVTISCPPYNSLTFSQPQTCSCQPCGNIMIDIIVRVTSSSDGQPVMMAMVEYGTDGMGYTNSLGLLTISQLISNGTLDLNITETNHIDRIGLSVDLIPPGPITISVVLLSRTTGTYDVTSNNVTTVGSIANVTFMDGQLDTGITLLSYIAPEIPLTFDTRLPPPVVMGDIFYAVRVIAETRLTDNSNMPVSTSADVEILFNSSASNSMLSLLTFNARVWTVEMEFPSMMPNANLPDTELTWAIGYPVTPMCYVQVRTLQREEYPLDNVEVEVIQLVEEFDQPFFFRSADTTGESSMVCLPILCDIDQAVEGTIRARNALTQVRLNANAAQPSGFTAADQSINITGNVSALFTSAVACNDAAGPYVRFDLPIANPPSSDIEVSTNATGFMFLRVSWYDCLDSNQVFTVSTDSSSDILSIYGITVDEMGEIDPGLHDQLNDNLIDYLVSGRPPNCADNMAAVSARTACIQVEPNTHVTLQVELNAESNMRDFGEELCSVNKTIGRNMELNTELNTTNNQLRIDLEMLLSEFDDLEMNMTMVNNLGIYYSRESADVAFSDCMNLPYNSMSGAELYGTIAVFSCFTP